MIQPDDVTSLTDFKRDTPAYLRRLCKTGRPSVLTINGKAAVVVLDPKTYQQLAELADRADTVIGIRKGMESFERGEGLPAREALEAAFAKLRAARGRTKRGKHAR